jgi:hypothetical protein
VHFLRHHTVRVVPVLVLTCCQALEPQEYELLLAIRDIKAEYRYEGAAAEQACGHVLHQVGTAKHVLCVLSRLVIAL